MTKQEAVYWKRFIEEMITERLPYYRVTDEEAQRISEFATHYMQTITGQQPLPQSVFRKFLEIFGSIPAIQEDILKAQAEISAWLEKLEDLATETNATANKEEILNAIAELNIFEECTVSDIYKMFNEFAAPFVLDDEGYILVTNLVQVDDEGYLILPSPALDLDRCIEVVTI